MIRRTAAILGCLALGTLILSPGGAWADDADAASTVEEATGKEPTTPMVVMKTSKGDLKIELYPAKAPKTVENFLQYVRDGFYDGTVFHRVMPGFVIQGGGMTKDLARKATRAPIENEAANGLLNKRGTLSMARTNDVNSATSQFFINLRDNTSLDHKDTTARGYGYAVYGKVIEGLDVVDEIAKTPTGEAKNPENSAFPYEDVPVEPVFIQKAYVEGEEGR
jgi:cyclophilin family peptidyl-prolyl cis-trans isomerase